MTKTLEEIKGMNIPIGTPIEIKWELEYTKETYRDIGYFKGLTSYRQRGGKEIQEIIITSRAEDTHTGNRRNISKIKDIKILEYKK